MNLFKPKEKINIYSDLDIKKYANLGFKAIFLDIDNTIALSRIGNLDIKNEKFIDELQNNGIKVVIFSNAKRKRVLNFLQGKKLDYTYYSLKPLPFKFWIEAFKLRIKPKNILVLGDQLLTDILGANLSGCYGIYTKQLGDKDTFLTSINRRIEKFIWRYMK